MALVLAGCSATTVRDDAAGQRESLYQSRLANIGAMDAWALEGRLAVSDQDDGGSGSFRWASLGTQTRMSFYGALGRGAWQLQASQSGAELQVADGGVYRAATVGKLVERQLGWNMPVDALAWWVRGLAAPGEIAVRKLDEQGRISRLQQQDWKVEFGRYLDVDGVAMPGRITARQQGRTVKLAVRNWTLGPESGHD